MRSLITATWSILVLAGLLAATSPAQSSGSAPGQNPSGGYINAAWQGGGRPFGSYLQSCRDVRDDGNRVSANCKRADGGWNNTSLDYRRCRGQIVNDNGNLRCGNTGSWQGGGQGGNWQGGVPRGDYMQSCQDARMNGNRLEARCQRRDGGWNSTSLNDPNSCRGQIINDDGNLRCGSGSWHGGGQGGNWQGGVPRGDYMQSCQDARMNGNRLEARCQRRDGGWNSTSLNNPNNCRGIVNDDGQLRCR